MRDTNLKRGCRCPTVMVRCCHVDLFRNIKQFEITTGNLRWDMIPILRLHTYMARIRVKWIIYNVTAHVQRHNEQRAKLTNLYCHVAARQRNVFV